MRTYTYQVKEDSLAKAWNEGVEQIRGQETLHTPFTTDPYIKNFEFLGEAYPTVIDNTDVDEEEADSEYDNEALNINE